MDSSICAKCGEKLADDALFCGHCGVMIQGKHIGDATQQSLYILPKPASIQPGPTQHESNRQVAGLSTLPLPPSNSSPKLTPPPPVRRRTRRGFLLGCGTMTLLLAAGGALAYTQRDTLLPQLRNWLRTHDYNPLPHSSVGTLRYRYPGGDGSVGSVDWSPTAQRIASAAGPQDLTGGRIHIWDALTGQHDQIEEHHTRNVQSVAWSADGQYLASAGSDSTVQIWDIKSQNQIQSWSTADTVWEVSWSPDGAFLAAAINDGTVNVWNTKSGRSAFTYRGHRDVVYTVAWSPDGGKIASGSWDHTVHTWDLDSDRPSNVYEGHEDKVTALSWSTDSTFIVSGSSDNTVHVWNAATGQMRQIYREHSGVIQSVSWSPDGKQIVSCSADETVKLWDPEQSTSVYTYLPHGMTPWTVCWSPDSQYVATGLQDGSVHVWQAR